MAESKRYQYVDIARPTFPYKSYTSPVDESPHFTIGSQNIMASMIGYLEKRPGFSGRINDSLVTPTNIKRIFQWRRWSGSFFVMLSSVEAGVAKVYKQELTVDTGFNLIWTSTTDVPFDFVVSNNFCFFGNGTDMRKFDGTTVSKWGCDAPPSAPDISLLSGVFPTGLTAVGNTISGTPTVQGNYQLTATVTDATSVTTSRTFNLEVQAPTFHITTPSVLPEIGTTGGPYTIPFATQFGTGSVTWSLFSGSIPSGMTLNTGAGTITGTPVIQGPYTFALKATDGASNTSIQSFSLYVETIGPLSVAPASPLTSGTVGSVYSNTITVSGGIAPYNISFLSSSGSTPSEPFNTFPQGLTFSPDPSTGVVTLAGTPTVSGSWSFRILALDSAAHSIVFDYTINILPNALTIQTINLPIAYVGNAYSASISVAGGTAPYSYAWTAGTLDGQTGYIYGYSYTTIYGHESNVSPLSNTTGIFTSQDPAVLLIASSDPQVNGINLYRTTDGGVADPAIMRLVASLSNTNQTYVDSTQDIDLGTQTGPGFLINTPPTPCRGFRWSNGRIYGFDKATTPYSGLEEVSNGIPEEAWPSGADGNFYQWPSQVGGMAVTDNGVDIGLSEQFWQISGDSLDTFRKSKLIDSAGVGSPTCINTVGNTVEWVDSAKQIWSSSQGEFGEPIRLDLANIQPDTTYIGYHKSGNFNWSYVLDSLAGKLYIFDQDTDQWYPPWTVAATAISSGETSPGVIDLLVAIGSNVFKLVPNTYIDGLSTQYEDDIVIGLQPISPGRRTQARTKMEPAQMEEVLFEMNSVDGTPIQYPVFVGILCDDIPGQAAFDDWFDLTSTFTTPQFIPVRPKLCQNRYICDSNTDPAIRVAFWVQFSPSNVGWKVYTFSYSFIPGQL